MEMKPDIEKLKKLISEVETLAGKYRKDVDMAIPVLELEDLAENMKRHVAYRESGRYVGIEPGLSYRPARIL
jgi:hypothetical protein